MDINVNDGSLDLLIERISGGTCILVLGPNIALSDPGKSMNALLKEYLYKKYPASIKHYADDEFFSFSGDIKDLANLQIRNYYKGLKANDVYYKIAEIPFHLILSVSPDHLLKDVFDEKKYDYSFDFYNKEQNPAPVEKPTVKKPLLYNLFGDVDSEGSLIFTYDDLFDYLIKMFGDFKLPQALQNELKLVKHVLFLGFDFEKWYFKLLLRLLKLNELNTKNASNKDKNMIPQVVNFYLDEFKMKFIEHNEMEILDAIYQMCMEKNILRSGSVAKSVNTTDVTISYGWGGESEEVANNIENSFKDKGINIIRDKKDLGYTGDIKTFMNRIGKGKYVVVIISDKYLKSENCMYEIVEIKKNGDLQSRIFPIVLGDANIYDDSIRIDYLKYWDKKKKDLNDYYNTLDDKMGTENILSKINLYGDIRRVFDEITATLSNMNALTPEKHKENDFSSLIGAIVQKVNDDNK